VGLGLSVARRVTRAAPPRAAPPSNDVTFCSAPG